MRSTTVGGADAGANAFLRPATIGAAIFLLVNDHVLKVEWRGVVTGKLSDIAGVFLLPLLAVGMFELVLRRPTTATSLLVAITATAIGFTAVKLWQPAASAYGDAVGVIRWPVAA